MKKTGSLLLALVLTLAVSGCVTNPTDEPKGAPWGVGAVQYRAATKTMTITFLSGRIFEYYEVPKPTWEGIKDAGNMSDYFQKRIKDRFESQEKSLYE